MWLLLGLYLLPFSELRQWLCSCVVAGMAVIAVSAADMVSAAAVIAAAVVTASFGCIGYGRSI